MKLKEEIKLFFNKSIAENANVYYDKSKKLRKKLPGVETTILKTQKELDNLNENYFRILKNLEREKKIQKTPKIWYEKFRYSWTSSGILFVFGKDATSNEVIIKKYTLPEDVVFHTTYPGSPFGVLKPEKNQEITKEDILEAGQIILGFSKVWKGGYGTGDFFYVNAGQITKKTISGEYIQKGSFMVYGDKNIVKNVPLKLSFGYYVEKVKVEDDEIEIKKLFIGTKRTAQKICKKFVNLEPGDEKQKTLYKKIKNVLKIDSKDFPSFIPANTKMLRK